MNNEEVNTGTNHHHSPKTTLTPNHPLKPEVGQQGLSLLRLLKRFNSFLLARLITDRSVLKLTSVCLLVYLCTGLNVKLPAFFVSLHPFLSLFSSIELYMQYHSVDSLFIIYWRQTFYAAYN